MLADNLQHASFTEALRKTFDGEHPCSLCNQIAVGKKSDKKSEFPPQLKKFEFLVATSRFIFTTPTLCWRLGVAEHLAKSTSLPPPTPPPRRGCV
jgi:hypothetical protein